MSGSDQVEKVSCCHPEQAENHQSHSPSPKTGVTFKIEGLDCVEEVTNLKSEIGPLVGGGDKLIFDVINGRMTIVADAKQVTAKVIIKAVAATGMEAIPW